MSIIEVQTHCTKSKQRFIRTQETRSKPQVSFKIPGYKLPCIHKRQKIYADNQELQNRYIDAKQRYKDARKIFENAYNEVRKNIDENKLIGKDSEKVVKKKVSRKKLSETKIYGTHKDVPMPIQQNFLSIFFIV